MLLSEKFIKANDLMCDFENHVPSPYFRKMFNLDCLPKSAEITVCGLGFYKLWINGVEITRGHLSPYISNPDHIKYYDNYDITEHMRVGKNVIGVQLGNGFRNAFGGFVWNFHKAECRGPVCLALAAEIDGKLCFEADESFKTHPSPVIFDDIRMGCRYDARLEITDWNLPSFNDEAWDNALICESPKGLPKICEADPIVTLREIKPISVKHFDSLPFMYEYIGSYTNPNQQSKPLESTVRDNVYVFDFGVNSAGVTKLHINGKPGQKITIRHAEHLIRGNFCIDTTCFYDVPDQKRAEYYFNYGQTDVYICKGGDETFVPEFKYDGFRYAYVEGLEPEQLTDDTLTFIEQSSYMEKRAEFKCSNDILNKLQFCTEVSDRANFFWFPTDCPHREKNGWTGDASTSAEQFLLNYKMGGLLKEWLNNIKAAQRPDGNVPGIVPTGGWGYGWGNGPAWDAVMVNLPYYIYKYDGDKDAVLQCRDMILKYFEYGKSRLTAEGFAEFGLEDWVHPLGKAPSPLKFTSTAEYFDIGTKAAEMFSAVGDCEAAEISRNFAEIAKAAIRKHLIDFDTMTVEGNCQTSQAVAIEMGLFDESEISKAREKLVEIVHRDGDIMSCGMIGCRYILHALVNAGEIDLAYKITTRTDVRSCYGYWIANGATSLWEDFKDVNGPVSSRNHHFFGDVSSFLIRDIAGLKPNHSNKGIDTFEISPHFPADLNFAEAEYKSHLGVVSVRWERIDGKLLITVNNPDSAVTTLKLCDGYVTDLGSRELKLPFGKSVVTVVK